MPAFMTTNTKAATRPSRASVVWREGPLPPRQEGLEDDADGGRTEDDQHRRECPVLDAR